MPADLAVARAQLVGLQAVEYAQRLFRAAPHVEVVHGHVLYGVVGIDDEGRPQRDTCGFFAHAELIDERAGRVGELPVVEAVEVLMLPAPRKLAELVVRRARHQHGVAVLEVFRELRVAGDLGRAHEGEVLGVEVDHLPFSWKRFFTDRLESGLAFFLVLVEAGLDAHHAECLEFVAYSLHC
jgi:hypothetical protein